jgi:YesN/AraC family two-component response regulator
MFNDAVMFGSRTVKQVLSSTYYSEMHYFLQSFKKETADARSMEMWRKRVLIQSAFCSFA